VISDRSITVIMNFNPAPVSLWIRLSVPCVFSSITHQAAVSNVYTSFSELICFHGETRNIVNTYLRKILRAGSGDSREPFCRTGVRHLPNDTQRRNGTELICADQQIIKGQLVAHGGHSNIAVLQIFYLLCRNLFSELLKMACETLFGKKH